MPMEQMFHVVAIPDMVRSRREWRWTPGLPRRFQGRQDPDQAAPVDHAEHAERPEDVSLHG